MAEFWNPAGPMRGRPAIPPPMGSDRYPALGAAPDDYVRG